MINVILVGIVVVNAIMMYSMLIFSVYEVVKCIL